MSVKQEEYFFRPGRERGAQATPGILCWQGKYEMICQYTNKNEIEYTYRCKHRSHPSFKCKAICKVVNIDVYGNTPKYIVSTSGDKISHSCEPDEASMEAELLKAKIKELFRDDPAKPVSKAIHQIGLEAAEKYIENEELLAG